MLQSYSVASELCREWEAGPLVIPVISFLLSYLGCPRRRAHFNFKKLVDARELHRCDRPKRVFMCFSFCNDPKAFIRGFVRPSVVVSCNFSRGPAKFI